MKGKLIVLACVASTSLAFAQTNVSQAGADRASNGSRTETSANVTTSQIAAVTSFIPGRSIGISTTPLTQPVNYLLSGDVQYVNSSGAKIDPSLIRPGSRVQLGVGRAGDKRTVDRVVLVEPE